MKQNLANATDWILAHEGGYVNHPDDPGGATNYGVIQRTYNAFRTKKGQAPRSVKKITKAEVLAIYKEQYWDKVWGDHLPSGLDYAVYDFAINSGPSRAVKFVQKLVGTKQDGVLGNVTLDAIQRQDIPQLISDLCHNRWNWLKRLRNYKTFGRGWTRRIMGEEIGIQKLDYGVIDRATMLAKDVSNITAPTVRDDGSDARTDGDEKLTHSAEFAEGLTFDNLSKIALGSVPAWAASENLDNPAVTIAIGVLAVVVAVWLFKKLR